MVHNIAFPMGMRQTATLTTLTKYDTILVLRGRKPETDVEAIRRRRVHDSTFTENVGSFRNERQVSEDVPLGASSLFAFVTGILQPSVSANPEDCALSLLPPSSIGRQKGNEGFRRDESEDQEHEHHLRDARGDASHMLCVSGRMAN